MALGSSYAKSLASKAPPPDALAALDAEPMGEMMEDEDEDADAAIAMSAYEDFARLAGFKPTPATFAAFREAVKAVR